MRMPDENFMLRQIDQARTDFVSIETDLEFLMRRGNQLPTASDLWRIAMLIALIGGVLGIIGLKNFRAYFPRAVRSEPDCRWTICDLGRVTWPRLWSRFLPRCWCCPPASLLGSCSARSRRAQSWFSRRQRSRKKSKSRLPLGEDELMSQIFLESDRDRLSAGDRLHPHSPTHRLTGCGRINALGPVS
jgi:hypothetical protein